MSDLSQPGQVRVRSFDTNLGVIVLGRQYGKRLRRLPPKEGETNGVSSTRQNQAAQTAIRALRVRGLAFTTISTSCPSATRKRISRSTEKPSSL